MKPESAKAQIERRVDPRIPVIVGLRYATQADSEGEDMNIGSAETVDIGASGLQLRVAEALKVPAHVQVAVRLADRTAPVVLLGRTIWCRPDTAGSHCVGIQFMGHIDPAFLESLEELSS